MSTARYDSGYFYDIVQFYFSSERTHGQLVRALKDDHAFAQTPSARWGSSSVR
jgi:hypothetical protein